MLKFLAPVIVSVVTFLVSQTSFACQVPVCDIAATIEDLKTKTSDERSEFYSDLYKENLNSKDAAVLRNLRAFGAEAYKLSKEINDTKVIIKWAADVRQIGQALLTYADFQKEEFISTYIESASIPELSRDSQQRVRFSALYRWKTEVLFMFDIKKIYDAAEYVQKASALSKEFNDEDYIIREAQMVLELLSTRISYLYPLYEGVFVIKTKCNHLVGQCSEKDLLADRLVVMNSFTDYDIYSSLAISSEINFAAAIGKYSQGINFLFIKSLIKDNGTSLYSKSNILNVGERPAEIQASFAENQDVTGTAVTSQYVGALNYSGKVIFSPLKYYADEVPVLAGTQPTTGEFVGTFGHQKMRLIIRQRVDATLMATAFIGVDSNSEITKIDFSMGQFVAHRQIINLTGVGVLQFTPYKITVAYRIGADGKIHWLGGFYATNGFFAEVSFDYAGPNASL